MLTRPGKEELNTCGKNDYKKAGHSRREQELAIEKRKKKGFKERGRSKG